MSPDTINHSLLVICDGVIHAVVSAIIQINDIT